MFRKRGENLRSIYVLLFLQIAFFLLEYQDPRKFAMLFEFDKRAVAAGQLWRLVTYQFTVSVQGWPFLGRPLILFLYLILLYLLGAALEEAWGTRYFITFFLISTLSTAAIAARLDVTLLGAYFISYSLLFAYATIFPRNTLYLAGAIPIHIRWLAYFAAGVLIFGAVQGKSPVNLAILGGVAAGYVYLLLQRAAPPPDAVSPEPGSMIDASAMRNGARFAAMKKVLANGAAADVDRLIAQCDREVVKGVNVCPPPDYKPEDSDGYCIRCEGFAECSARFLRARRPADIATPTTAAESV